MIKKVLLYSLIISITVFACKPKQEVVSTSKAEPAPAAKTEETNAAPKTVGKISHRYRAEGCATVIIVPGGPEMLTLIPRSKLPANVDVDGLEVVFYYRTLRMPQPAGCTKGIPAEIKDITKR